MTGLGWTPKADAELRRLAAEGLTSSQIAQGLGHGCTRNMVIGRARRIGVKLLVPQFTRGENYRPRPVRKAPWKPTAPQTASRPLYSPETVPAVSEPPVARQMASEPVTIEQLRFPISQCRWIDGEPGVGALYCGARTLDGSSYCHEHHHRCRVPYVRRYRHLEAAS